LARAVRSLRRIKQVTRVARARSNKTAVDE
jgi:hypothetical protein